VEGRHGPGLRALPAVHELAARLDAPRADAVAAARAAIEEHRRAILAGQPPAGALLARARALLRPSPVRVVNATGVLAHTNLGRAPLAREAQEAVARVAAGYSDLELDLAGGGRGSRQDHVTTLLCELTGAADALVVNNGAGAVLLAVAALAGPDRPVVVSRGELVEIGGGFRIPEVVAQAGAPLREVGTTNRTHLADYERALDGDAVILRVHQSNFRTVGFVDRPAIEELCRLGAPVIDDAGSGVLVPGLPELGDEPPLRRSIAAGAALVCCSGDKLLGGPQAGLLLGSAEAIAAAGAHPLARALRIDKLSVAALAATLRLYRDPARAREEIPVLRMLERSDLAAVADRLAAAIGSAARVVEVVSRAGGGALPLTELIGPGVAVAGDAVGLADRLRAGDPPVLGRIRDGELVLDPRTLLEGEPATVAAAVRAALACP
jgi:L-seryl-tRNA(Ser) seleniumtransferase